MPGLPSHAAKAAQPQSLPTVPTQHAHMGLGMMGSGDCGAPAALHGLGRDEEMVQDCLIAAWCTANYSYEFRDGYKAYDSLHAHPAGSATPKGTEHREGMAEGQTHLRDEDPQL